jgi:hypothetical protein
MTESVLEVMYSSVKNERQKRVLVLRKLLTNSAWRRPGEVDNS